MVYWVLWLVFMLIFVFRIIKGVMYEIWWLKFYVDVRFDGLDVENENEMVEIWGWILCGW